MLHVQQQPQTPAELAACGEINRLFDLFIVKTGIHEYELFVRILGDSEKTREAFGRFLTNVSTCPQSVIDYCKERL